MKRILIIALALCMSVCCAVGKTHRQDKAFGWATMASLQGGAYNLCGGDTGRTIVLKSNGMDMREEVKNAIKNFDKGVFGLFLVFLFGLTFFGDRTVIAL